MSAVNISRSLPRNVVSTYKMRHSGGSSEALRAAWAEAVDRPLVEAEALLERRQRATQCCCFCCSCPLSEGVYWALGLLCVEALVQLVTFLARPPWLWRVTPFILFCFLLQVATRLTMLSLSAYAFHKLRQGRSVVFILRMQLRGLVWLCILELVVMGVSLAEEHLLCDTPVLEQMRNRHEALDEPLCELGSDLFDVSRAAVSLAILVYCGWIIHSLARGLLDAAAHGATGRSGDGDGMRMLQRVTSLAKYTSRAQTTEPPPTPCFGASGRPSGAEGDAGGQAGAAPAAAASPHSSSSVPSALSQAESWGAEEAAAGSPEVTGRGKNRHRTKRLGKSRGRPPAEQPGAADLPRSSPTRRLSRTHRILSRVRSKGRENRTGPSVV